MKKFIIFTAFVLILSSALLVPSESSDGAEVTEPYDNVMANVYNIIETSSNTPNSNSAKVITLENGSVDDVEFRKALEEGRNVAFPGTTYSGSNKSIYVISFIDNPYMTGVYTQPSDDNRIVSMDIEKHHLLSGQTVNLSIDEEVFFGGIYMWSIMGDDDYYVDAISDAESEYLTPNAGDYSLYVKSYYSTFPIFVSYELTYEPFAPSGDAVYGYAAIVIGVICVALVFIFGWRQRLD